MLPCESFVPRVLLEIVCNPALVGRSDARRLDPYSMARDLSDRDPAPAGHKL
jgi:hypothetical protein